MINLKRPWALSVGYGRFRLPLVAVLPIILLVALLTTTVVKTQNAKPAEVKGMVGTVDRPFYVGCREPDVDAPRANATIVILARNTDLQGTLISVSSFERHFNRFFHYPYTFINDEPFSKNFVETVSQYISSPAEFHQISADDWEFPPEVNSTWIEESLQRQGDESIMYGKLKSYHQMCRYFSGKFYDHPALQKYEWYWRVEPDIQFFCDITYDVFREMEINNKEYGFNVFIEEFKPTVWNLFRHTETFRRRNGIAKTDFWDAITSCRKNNQDKALNRTAKSSTATASGTSKPISYRDNDYMDGCRYNLCHFWSNFEIARVGLWQRPIYREYFETLEAAGGFWNERWGDAPVHTLGVALMLNASQLHYFRDIGYQHTNIGHCPGNAPNQIPLSAHGEYNQFDEYWAEIDPSVKNGVGCRCRCPTNSETEGHFCFQKHMAKLFGGFVPENDYGDYP